MAKATSKATGDALEQRVALYYEALGYQVSRDVFVAGHQIDLLATKHMPGVGDMSIAVEAKHRAGTMGINDLTQPISTSKHLIESGAVAGFVTVTDAKVSRPARLAADACATLKLLTLGDLELHLFNNAHSLLRVVADYEHKSIFHTYYALGGKDDGSTKHDDIAPFIYDWSKTSHGILMLVGDFGSGKSTILDRVFYEAARARIDSKEQRFPILLRLRGIRQFGDLWQFVETSLRDSQYISPPRSVFDHELNEGRLIVMLDGFDEIYSGATAADRASYLETLRPLLKSRSPVVLSSRPTFFQSFDDMIASVRRLSAKQQPLERLPNFGLDRAKIAKAFGADLNKSLRRNDFARVLEIQQLDRSQIRAAIERQAEEIKRGTGLSVASFEEHLYSIYDLEDLMSRPLLLDMILKTVATGAIDIRSQKTVGAATLYDLYTQQAANRDNERATANQLLTPEIRLDACRAIARAMLDKGEIVLTSDEVEAAVQVSLNRTAPEGARGARRRPDVGSAVTDVRTCSFLRFNEEGSLHFTHKSFYEFFVAQDLFVASGRSSRAFLDYPRARLNRETIYFLASYVRDQEAFATFVKTRLRERQDEDDRSFLYSLAFASGEVLEKSSLTGGTVSGVEMAKVRVKNAYALSTRFEQVTLRQVVCTQWKLVDVTLDGCNVIQTHITGSTLDLSVQETSFENCIVDKTEITLRGKSATLSDTKLDECRIDFACAVTISGCLLTRCERIVIEAGGRLYGQRVDIANSTVVATGEESWYSGGSRISLDECLISGLLLFGRDLFTDLASHAEERIVLRECRGIAYLSLTDELEKHGIADRVRALNPDLLLLNQKTVRQARTFLEGREKAGGRMASGSSPPAKSALGPSGIARARPKELGKRPDVPPELIALSEQVRDHLARTRLGLNTVPDVIKAVVGLAESAPASSGPTV